jgi:hypothetical protein
VIVSLVYVAWDKRLAFRLALVAIGAMCLIHGLKTLIANPRPFVGMLATPYLFLRTGLAKRVA